MDPTTIRQLRRTLREFEQLLGSQTRDCCRGLTIAQCDLLLEIGARGETSAGSLSRRLKLDPGALSRTVDALVRRGVVRRRPHGTDRRITLLSLTDAGTAICDAINLDADARILDVLGHIPTRQRNAVIRNLTLFVKAFKAHEQEKDAAECGQSTRPHATHNAVHST